MTAAQRIERLTEKWEAATRDAFLSAIKDIRDSIVLKRLEAAILAGDIPGALREVGLDPARLRALDGAVAGAYEEGATEAFIGINAMRRAGGALAFDVRAFSAEAWLRANNEGLVSNIMSDQGVMVREHLGAAVAKGQNPHDAALELVGRINKVTGRREGGLIGLTTSQAQWVRSYEAEITGVPTADALKRTLRDRRFDRTVAKAIREGTPIPAETREAMLNAYRNRALKFRAENIGQMESLKAIHQAQIEAYEQAIAKGAIRADQVRRYWITMGDSRVRPEHRLIPMMNKKGVGLRQTFNTPTGPAMYPPHGFGCRCRVKIVVESRVAVAA